MGCMAEEAMLKLYSDFCGLPPGLSVAPSSAGVGCWGAGVTAAEAVRPAGCIGLQVCVGLTNSCVLSRC